MIFVQQFLLFYYLKCKRWFPYKSNVHKEPFFSFEKRSQRTLFIKKMKGSTLGVSSICFMF